VIVEADHLGRTIFARRGFEYQPGVAAVPARNDVAPEQEAAESVSRPAPWYGGVRRRRFPKPAEGLRLAVQ
jgi:hypothetical protein